MRKIYIIHTIIFMLFISVPVFSQKQITDANIIGHAVCSGKHIPFINIVVKGTTIGTATDETGHYQLINLPVRELTISASMVGYKTQEKTVTTEANKTLEINFELEEDILNLDEIIVSADRSRQKRIEAPVIVNTISLALFSASQSFTLAEGLNFSPGLRLENNCQNCGFTQVRMNGMEGSYSQILINSRPIFSSLAGVYGLELLPASMIDKVEVVRGGGSALFGSNAIAGTINIILKEPVTNTYEAGTSYALTGAGVSGSGGTVPDFSANFNTTLVTDDHKTGMVLYGFTRERKMFDANNDDFSELPLINNLTMGTRFFHRFTMRSKLSADFFAIREQRDGGDKQDYPIHERNIAEALRHNLKVAALTYEQFFRQYDMLSLYASGQFLNRDSYYGANKSLSSYGNSKDKTYNFGTHYKAIFKNSSLITGLENTGGFLTDKKLGYPDYENAVIINDSIVEVPHAKNKIITEQSSSTIGIFTQYELKLNKIKIAVGGRYDHYEVKNFTGNETKIKKGNIFSPRISLMYEIVKELQSRISYAKGYRAPQIFDEDLDIKTSGARQVINVNDPDLKQENSHSIMVSLDFNRLTGTVYTGFLLEGFYTKLKDPFVIEIGVPDKDGTVIYTRKNSEDEATVLGINTEFKLKPLKAFSLTSGFTMQKSKYDVAQKFDEKRFFRTPDQYGYFSLDWDFIDNVSVSATGNYTGSMLVPYFGTETTAGIGELHRSENFFDLGLKLKHTLKLNGLSIQFFGGIKNIFNSWQSDFDKGVNRDPAYIYGPVNPRTIYFGITAGNALNK